MIIPKERGFYVSINRSKKIVWGVIVQVPIKKLIGLSNDRPYGLDVDFDRLVDRHTPQSLLNEEINPPD